MIKRFITWLLALVQYRRLTRGFALGNHRFTQNKGWREKPHPYWFRRTYDDGTKTLQIMRLEYWNFGY